jgi:hypothetical protein
LKGYESQEAYFNKLCDKPHDPYSNFLNCYNAIIRDFHKFGRYSTWFYLQILKQCVGLNIEPETLLLSDPGSESHRNGFLYAMGREDLIDQPITKEQYQEFEEIAATVLNETRRRFPDVAHRIDYFAMETCLCSFKKLFRTRDGRYLGYYLDRQAEEIQKVEKDGWIGINWKPLWQCREEIVDKKWLTNAIDPAKMHLFLKTGDIHAELEKSALEDFFN